MNRTRNRMMGCWTLGAISGAVLITGIDANTLGSTYLIGPCALVELILIAAMAAIVNSQE